MHEFVMPNSARDQKRLHNNTVRNRMRIFVTLVVLFAALFIILIGRYDSDTQKWAYGIVGLVIGYWLKIG
jgi:uncharacterized membrane protein